MRKIARKTIDAVDVLLAQISLAIAGDGSSLIIPMFHGIYPDRLTAKSGLFDPLHGVTLPQFRMLLAYFQKAGFQFIRPDDLQGGLSKGGKYVMLTFDDGYYNNFSVLPMLHEFKAPAVFFASADHVREGKAFWWDVLLRERKRSDGTASKNGALRIDCKSLETEEVENRLKAAFKLDRLVPVGDLDRPMTPAELKQLSQDKYAVIGNHTLNHAILTNYSADGVREQIEGAQESLFKMTGIRPSCIAYPNGNCTPSIIEAAVRAGLSSGVIASGGKNPVPIPASGNARMTLKRDVLCGNRSVEPQCDVFRSRVSMHRFISHARAGGHY